MLLPSYKKVREFSDFGEHDGNYHKENEVAISSHGGIGGHLVVKHLEVTAVVFWHFITKTEVNLTCVK